MDEEKKPYVRKAHDKLGGVENAKKGGSSEALQYKQALFCKEYIVDFSAKKAALRAGYSEMTAAKKSYQWLQNPKIIKELDRLQGRREVRTQITADEILKRLMRIADKCETEQDYNACLRALELLGKNKAMFTDKNITEIVKNPFASGQDDEAIERDAHRLKAVIRSGAKQHPGLHVIEGGKNEDIDDDEEDSEPEDDDT